MAPRPVYSVQFLIGTDAEPQIEQQIPEGFTAVLRFASLYSGSAENAASLAIVEEPGSPTVTIARLRTTGAGYTDQWEGRVVIQPLGYVYMFLDVEDAGSQWYVGGYLLTGTVE